VQRVFEIMITIDLSETRRGTGLSNGALAMLEPLLARCEKEDIRDVLFRFPDELDGEWASAWQPVLQKPMRFAAWFNELPGHELADTFISAGHRVTLAGTACSDGDVISRLLNSRVYATGAPWQVRLFLALPVPMVDLSRLAPLRPRAGTVVTIGLGWQHPDSGPLDSLTNGQSEWAETLLAWARFWTRQGVNVTFACGLPLCLLSTEQLGELALTKVRLPVAYCTPELVVTLDGWAKACPRIPGQGWAALPEQGSLREFAKELAGAPGHFAAFCDGPNEQSCRSFATAACGGGCMARNVNSWRGGDAQC
jgi:hypothetical protein